MTVHMRHTRAHTGNRRSHHALKVPGLVSCAKCKERHLPHRVCMNCGTYRGRQVIDVAARQAKKTAKAKARQEAAKTAGGSEDKE